MKNDSNYKETNESRIERRNHLKIYHLKSAHSKIIFMPLNEPETLSKLIWKSIFFYSLHPVIESYKNILEN